MTMHISALPAELLTEIFSHIADFMSKQACRLVCRRWLACADNRQSWRRHFDRLHIAIRPTSHDMTPLVYSLNNVDQAWLVTAFVSFDLLLTQVRECG